MITCSFLGPVCDISSLLGQAMNAVLDAVCTLASGESCSIPFVPQFLINFTCYLY